MPSYAYKLLVACDQLMNAILGGWAGRDPQLPLLALA